MELYGVTLRSMPGIDDQCFLVASLNTFIGPNGSGKSRVLHTIARILESWESSSSWNGYDQRDHAQINPKELLHRLGSSVFFRLTPDEKFEVKFDDNADIPTVTTLPSQPKRGRPPTLQERDSDTIRRIAEWSNPGSTPLPSVRSSILRGETLSMPLETATSAIRTDSLDLEVLKLFETVWRSVPIADRAKIASSLLSRPVLRVSELMPLAFRKRNYRFMLYGQIAWSELANVISASTLARLIPRYQEYASRNDFFEVETTSRDSLSLYEESFNLPDDQEPSGKVEGNWNIDTEEFEEPTLVETFAVFRNGKAQVRDETNSDQLKDYPSCFSSEGYLLLPLIDINETTMAAVAIELPRTTVSGATVIYNEKMLDNAISSVSGLLLRAGMNEWRRSVAKWGGKAEYEWLVPSAHNQNSCVKLDNLILVARDLIETEVNKYLPSFISETYQFKLMIAPIEKWGDGPRSTAYLQRKRIQSNSIESETRIEHSAMFDSMLYEEEDRLVPIEETGSGIFRWIVVMLGLVTNALLRTTGDYYADFWKSVDEEEIEGFDDVDLDEFWRDRVLANVEDAFKTSVETDFANTVLILDEPEAHLHPAGISSIAPWIQDMSAQCGAVFVATHDPEILDIEMPRMRRFLFVQSNSSSTRRRIREFDIDVSALKILTNEIGVSTGELFLLTKRWLLVEGEVDKIVLQTWFRSLFVQSGVQCIPMRGERNVVHFGQMEIISGIASRVSVLLDAPIPGGDDHDEGFLRKRVRNGMLTSDLSSNNQVLLGFRDHSMFDIYFFFEPRFIVSQTKTTHTSKLLGEEFCFESWDVAWARFETWCLTSNKDGKLNRKGKTWSISMTNFKEFMDMHFGLKFTTDNARAIAAHQKDMGLVPNELKIVVETITEQFWFSSGLCG